MTGDRLEPPDALRSKTLPQRIDQDCAARHFVGSAGVVANKLVLLRGDGFGAGDGKPDGFKAEAGIFRRRLRLELQLDHPRHMSDIARRQRQRDVDRL